MPPRLPTWVEASGALFAQEIVEQIQTEIMTAGTEDGALHLRQRHQQINVDLLSMLFPFGGGVDAQDTIGLGQGGDGSRALFERHSDETLINAADDHAPELLDSSPRGQVFGQGGLDGNRWFQRNPLHLCQQRQHQLLHGDNRRDRITGNAHHRFVGNHAKDGRFARHDGHPVHQHFAQLFDDAYGVIGTSRG